MPSGIPVALLPALLRQQLNRSFSLVARPNSSLAAVYSRQLATSKQCEGGEAGTQWQPANYLIRQHQLNL
jgi:hypothetical protein